MAERLGPYTLDKRIGAGGMADVFLARGPMGVCVVKRPHPQLCANAEFVRMFLDEASLLAQLHHPGIAQIFDLGHVGDVYYLAMEYVPGFDLMTISLEHERHGELIAPELCARIVADVAAAMHYAHEAKSASGRPMQIVHRDLSPHNVLLSTRGVVKVIDFGVARASTATHRTAAGLVKGKYPYMAPEQITGQAIDRRVDVYALGLVLYELLTNVRAIAGNTEIEQIDNARASRIRPIEQLRPNVPVPLRQILGSCLHPSPNGRYQTADHLRADLEKYLSYERHVVGQEDLLRLFRVVAAEVSHVDFPVEEPPRPTEQEQAAVAAGVLPGDTLPPNVPDDIGYARTAPSFPKPAAAYQREAPTDPSRQSPIPLDRPVDAAPEPSPSSQVGPVVPPEVARAPTKLLPPSGVHTAATRMSPPPKRTGPVAALAALGLLLVVVAGLAVWWTIGRGTGEVREAPELPPVAVVDAGVAPVVDAGVAIAAAEAPDAGEADTTDAAVEPDAPVRIAVLEVSSSAPGLVVSVDGKDWGETPVTLELMPGDYAVSVRNDADGFKQTRRFTLAGGDRKKWVATAGSAKAAKGTLQISAPPFAAMYVDGKKVTAVPVAMKTLELSAGTHQVELVLVDSTLPKPRKKKRTVVVKPGAPTTLVVDMLVDD